MGVLPLPPRREVPQRQLLGAFLLLLLIPDVLPDDGLLEADGTHTVSPRPEMQACEVACPPKVFAMNADSGFPFQPPHGIRHTILGGNAQTQMYMIGHGMPLDQFDSHLVAEFPQDLANILAERAKDCFLPIFRYDDNVVSAIPPDMALILPFAHCGFSFLWPWRVHAGRNHIPLHESTPERQSLFESHRQRRWLTHWSYNYGYGMEQYGDFPCTCTAAHCMGYILAEEYWGLIKKKDECVPPFTHGVFYRVVRLTRPTVLREPYDAKSNLPSACSPPALGRKPVLCLAGMEGRLSIIAPCRYPLCHVSHVKPTVV